MKMMQEVFWFYWKKLEELDDVQNVFSNFNINDTLMEKLT